MNLTVKTSGPFSKSRGLQANAPAFSLPHPPPSTFLFLPHFSCKPNGEKLLRPEFRAHGTGTLATQATLRVNMESCACPCAFIKVTKCLRYPPLDTMGSPVKCTSPCLAQAYKNQTTTKKIN